MIENIISKSYVFNQAAMEIDKYDKNILKKDCIFLLSIGRFCEAKNFDNIPEICKYIINSGIDIQWNIIGFGGDLLTDMLLNPSFYQDLISHNQYVSRPFSFSH